MGYDIKRIYKHILTHHDSYGWRYRKLTQNKYEFELDWWGGEVLIILNPIGIK